ncbi:MAG: transcriptional regulator [Acidobacteriota bacterium]
MAPKPTDVQTELRQTRPFRSAEEEAAVGVMLTAERLRRQVAETVEPSGITHQQYNVLRILRGSHPGNLPTLEIATRMIESTPGITRLLDRLEIKGLVRRDRCRNDRRQVLCSITPAGLTLLAALDEPLRAALVDAFRELGEPEVRKLSKLLDKVRAGVGPAEPVET